MVKLEDYTATELKKLISRYNKEVKFPPYSKMKKSELISTLRTHPHLKIKEGDKLEIKVDISKSIDSPNMKMVYDNKKKEVDSEIKKLVSVKPTKDKKGVEIVRKDGKKHTEKEVKILKKAMPKANIKVEGKKLVVKDPKTITATKSDGSKVEFKMKEPKTLKPILLMPKKKKIIKN